ncbi:MAG: hypothetical protein PHI49_04195 [Halothiobacillaceae bacterium]|jgi:hypothetical protein|nr:hypothetical protein [Halothiobacillaceae bacterium]MDY0049927.1 hypothetical protein [Halothiobacillaceae bacterium]
MIRNGSDVAAFLADILVEGARVQGGPRALARALVLAMADLSERGFCPFDLRAFVHYASFENCVALATHPNLGHEAREAMGSYLSRLGYDFKRPIDEQSEKTRQHNYMFNALKPFLERRA